MKSLTNTQLNRIKIKDLIAAIRQNYDTKDILGLYQLDRLEKIQAFHLKDATDGDLESVERIFIERKLGIKYFPSQGKKKVTINGKQKIVPIDYEYGS